MKTTIRYIWLCALRDKLFLGLLAGIVFAAILSSFLGSTAYLESTEMMLSYMGASFRFIVAIGLMTFVCFHVQQHKDTQQLNVILSKPLSRTSIVVAYWLGFSAVAACIIIPIILLMAVINPLSWSGFALWSVSLMGEGLIIVALALFASLILGSAVSSVLACFGIYLVSRMMAFFLMTVESGLTERLEWHKFYALVLDGVSYILPRLDIFVNSEWLIYGVARENAWEIVLLQIAVYIPLLLTASAIDFKRKEF